MDELKTRAHNYTNKFNKALQHTKSRVQHHHHKKDAKGNRKPLPACRAQKTGDCKHGFPKTKLLTEKALVVCPGIAEKCGLRVSGRRNALGSILSRRNCVWINGTAPAFAVAFGFNTDVSPNDRLPIIKETHEVSCTRSSCVKDVNTGEVACAESRAQLDTDGYFGGYIVKSQPVGAYELRKCMKNMDVLRERIATQLTPADQARSVSHRMISDLELRGVLRGAPEVYNLSVNMRKEDSLFQECIRTFLEASFPGGAFLAKLEAETHGVGGVLIRRIPPSRGPKSKYRFMSAPQVDAYGFRGQDPQVLYLSPFEFCMYWEIQRVPEPFRKDCNGWSAWSKEGKEYYDNHKHDYDFKLLPGKHYKVTKQSLTIGKHYTHTSTRTCPRTDALALIRARATRHLSVRFLHARESVRVRVRVRVRVWLRSCIRFILSGKNKRSTTTFQTTSRFQTTLSWSGFVTSGSWCLVVGFTYLCLPTRRCHVPA